MNTALTLQIGGDISRLRTELNKANGLMNGFKNQLTNVGAAMGVTFGSAAIFQGLRYGAGVIKDFEKSMSEVRAITNATDGEFVALRENALELGRTTQFTAKQVSELQVAFGRLGFSNSEILNSTEATLQLASATGEDLAKSADIAGSTLRAFNLDASQMQRVVDVMAASFNKSALGLDNFGESMRYVAPIAAAANISIEETTAMLGVLADAGIRGSMAGTSLRKIISDVKDETGTLSERLQKLADKGLTGADAMDEVGRTAYASLLILTQHIDKVNQATDAYHNVNGEAQKMADLMLDNVAGDITKLTSAYDGLILKFSDGAGPVRDIVQGLTSLLNLISSDTAIGHLKAFVSTAIPFLNTARAVARFFKDEPKNQQEPDFLGPEKPGAGLFDLGNAAMQFGLNKNPKPPGGDSTDIRTLVAEWDRLNKKQKENPFIKKKTGSDFLFDTGVLTEFANVGSEALSGLNSALQINSNEMELWISGWKARMEIASKAMEEHREKTMKLAEAATTMGGVVGEVLGDLATGQKDFASTMMRATEQIINMYLQQSIAAMIAASIKDPSTPFPFAKIAIAAAGIGLVKALFSGLASNMSGGGSGSSGPPGRTPSEMNHRIGGRIRGYDLAIVNEKEGYRRSRVG
jgi:hypothetical protein